MRYIRNTEQYLGCVDKFFDKFIVQIFMNVNPLEVVSEYSFRI